MDRITQQFTQLAKSKKIAFMPFLVAGYPDFRISVKASIELGNKSDLLEIGFPYSDPLADGPTIQAADTAALKNGMTTKKCFEFIKEVRKKSETPITILVYANIVYQQGVKNFYKLAKQSGIDAVLVPDVPVEEIAEYAEAAKLAGIIPIFLVTQTTTNQRLQKILKYAEGYLYVVSVLGVTGARKSFDKTTLQMIRRIKSQTLLPLAIGFGISNREQIKNLRQAGADGVIVGSAFIKILSKSHGTKQSIKKLIHYKKTLID